MSENTQRMRFLSIFDEDQNETLKLKVKLQVRGETFEVGESFRKNDKIAGVDFHLLRYFDLAVEKLEDGTYQITGVFPQE